MKIKRLNKNNLSLVRELNMLFAEAFEDEKSYLQTPPSDGYLKKLLSQKTTFVLTAFEKNEMTGGLVAYEMQKFEQQRSEIYIYDLAVRENHRRKGVATALISRLGKIVKKRGAYVMMVQADNIDEPAVALYTKLASLVETEISHFDILV